MRNKETMIALLRGINVGGHHRLPMLELKVLFKQLGLENIKTYIQSGYVIFQTQNPDFSDLSEKISAAIYGVNPRYV